MSYSLKLLYSGSNGNAALLRVGEVCVLIDAGRSCRALVGALRAEGVEPEQISAVFLTHEHTDHIAALPRFLSRYPVPVYATAATADGLLCKCAEIDRTLLCPQPPLFEVELDGVSLASFPTSHDTVCSVGYRICVKSPDGVRFVGYATDLGIITPAVENGLLGCEAVVLECNHDEQMLLTGPYPHHLKVRIASRRGHLSNTDCAAFAARLAASGTGRFLLAHLSEINNTPELALGEVRGALCGFGAQIRVADPMMTTEL